MATDPTPAPPPPPLLYVPPSWSTTPIYPFSLEVLTKGVLADTIDLSRRAHYVLGRQAGVADIPVLHESVSRQHAVLQFGEHGELYITDLNSTHGTRVNKVLIEPNKYVLAPVGTILQFGESSRLFVVQGPAELAAPERKESAEHKALRLQSEQRQARKAAAVAGVPSSAGSGGGALWGDHEDAVEESPLTEENEGEGAGRLSIGFEARLSRQVTWLDDLDLTKLSEKEHEVYDRLHKRLLKLRNIAGEVARIRAKAAAGGGGDGRKGGSRNKDDVAAFEDASDGAEGGLSAGQQAQIERNEASIAALAALLEEDEELLRSRLMARGVPLPASARLRSVTASVRGHEDGAAGAFADREAAYLQEEEEVQDAFGGGAPPARAAAARPKLVLVKSSQPRLQQQQQRQRTVTQQGSGSRSVEPRGGAQDPSRAVETFSSLQTKLAALRARIGELEEAATAAPAVAAALPHPTAANTAAASEADELDAFMVTTQSSLAEDTAAKIASSVLLLRAEEARLQHILLVVTPALLEVALPTAAPPTAATPSHPTRESGAAPVLPGAGLPTVSAVAAAPANASAPEDSGRVVAAGGTDARGSSAVALPAKRARAAEAVHGGPAAVPPPSSSHASVTGVAASVAAVLGSVRQGLSGSCDEISRARAEATLVAAPPRASNAVYDSERDRGATWEPPSNQSGDGKTALNEKLGY